MIRLVRVLVLVLVVGCSNAAKRDPAPRGGDSIAAVVPDASIDTAAIAAPAASVDAAVAATFPWQKLRDSYDAFRRTPVGSQSCDPRLDDPEPRCPPLSVRERAARLVIGLRREAGRRYVATVDLGRLDGVREGWRAALVDSRERVISEWGTVRSVDKHSAQIAVPESWLAHEGQRNVALVER